MAELVVTDLTKSLGGRQVVSDLSFTVGSGELVCLLGPSGCGKTTTLRMIGGFIDPDGGSISIGGREVTSIPPERRPTAMVFQSYALWPNMTVFKNIAFGLHLKKMAKDEIADRVQEVLRLVNLSGSEKRQPTQLSGGEQQRVALARALVLEPELLLLDEPLSNLDARLRVAVREEIREIQQRLHIATLFVTHDQDEALSISDRVAVMSGGRVEQFSAPSELYRRPATTFVANFVGSTNFLPGRPAKGGLTVGESAILVPCPSPADPLADDEDGYDIAVRPEDILLSAEGAAGRVGLVVPHGHFTELQIELADIRLRAYVGNEQEPLVGEEVLVSFRRVLLYRDGSLAGECGTGRAPAVRLRAPA
jgi:putative spermidine/putrescine transport system ATP-binding protein